LNGHPQNEIWPHGTSARASGLFRRNGSCSFFRFL